MDRPRDIFNRALAKVVPLDIDAVDYLIENLPRNANGTGCCKALQTRRYVDPITVNIFALGNDVS